MSKTVDVSQETISKTNDLNDAQKKLLEALKSEVMGSTSKMTKEEYLRLQRAKQMVRDYLSIKKIREELIEKGIKTTESNIVDALIASWNENATKRDTEEI